MLYLLADATEATVWSASLLAVFTLAINAYFKLLNDRRLDELARQARLEASEARTRGEHDSAKLNHVVDKAKVVEDKLDANTQITREGTAAAAANAKAAVRTAVEAKVATETMADSINRKLNGGLDSAVAEVMKPIKESLDAHITQDAKDLQEVKERFDALAKYVHGGNHDILNALNAQSLKLDLTLKTLGVSK